MSHHLTIMRTESPSSRPTPLDPPEITVPHSRSVEFGARREGTRLEQRILRKVGQAVVEWDLIADGDRIMVCVSGGKDSYALLDMLLLLRRAAPVDYEVFAVNLDQGWPDYDTARIRAHLEQRGVEHHMLAADIASVVEAKLAPGATPCSLCSRLRRGALYRWATELGATKIALGHHLDDMAETLLLNLFYSGQLKSMPPRLVSDDGRHVVIRPLAYVEEKDTIAYQDEQAYPVARCGCPTCGLPDQKRQVMKRLLSSLEDDNPGVKTHMLAAMKNVRASHLLDRALIDSMARRGAEHRL